MSETLTAPAATDLTANANGIRLTDRASAHIKREMANEDTAIGFRIAVKKTGCSGWMYAVEFAHERRDNDVVFSVDNDLDIYVDAHSLGFLQGTEVDFIQEGLTRQLKFNNPNVSSECGCGESFAVG